MPGGDDLRVKMWHKRLQFADSKRQHYHDQWYKGWEIYFNRQPIPDIEGMFWGKPVRSPDGFTLIESVTPQHVLGMFRNPMWYSIEAPTVPGTMYKGVMKGLVDSGWRKADGFAKSVIVGKYGAITGTCPVRTTWETRLGAKRSPTIDFANTSYDGESLRPAFTDTVQQYVIHNGPQFQPIDLFKLWVDPTGRGLYAIEKQMHDKDELRYQNELLRGSLYNDGDLEKLNPTTSQREMGAARSEGMIESGGVFATGPFDVASLLEQVQGIPDSHSATEVELSLCWGFVPKSVRNYDNEELPTQWRFMVIGNLASQGIVLRDVAAPSPDFLPPYDLVQSIPVPFGLYGESLLSFTGDMMQLKNFIQNARKEDLIFNLHPPMMFDDNTTISDEDLFRQPGGALFVGGHLGKISDVAYPMPRQPILPEAYQETAVLDDQIRRASAASDNAQGFAAGGRTTATEAAIIATQGGARFNLATAWLDETYKRKVLERFVGLYRTRLEQAEVVKVAGVSGRRFKITLADLQHPVDIYVDSGLLGSLDSMKLEKATALLQVMQQDPRMAARMKVENIGRDMWLMAGFPRADEYYMSDEEFVQQQQQEQEAARNQMREEAVVQGELDVNKEMARGLAQRATERVGAGLQGGSPPGR